MPIPKTELNKRKYYEYKKQGLNKISLWMSRDEEAKVRNFLDKLRESKND